MRVRAGENRSGKGREGSTEGREREGEGIEQKIAPPRSTDHFKKSAPMVTAIIHAVSILNVQCRN